MNGTVIAITGISGLVGGNLARTLLSQGNQVRGLIYRDQRAIQDLDVERISGDVQDIASLRRLFSGAEVVYHLAAHIPLETAGRKQTEAVNVFGTRNVVAACLECNVQRLVHLSSIQALDQNSFKRESEMRSQTLPPFDRPYERSKAAGEIEVRRGIAKGLNAVILNPTGIIGPFDFKPSHFGKAILALAKGKVPALVQGGFDWIDVRDVVAAMLQAERLAPPGSNFILSGNYRSVRDVAAQVAARTGVPAPKITVPLWAAYLGLPLMKRLAKIQQRDPLYTRVSLDALRGSRPIHNDLARRVLKHKARSFEQTIADTVHWFTKNRYL